MSIPIVRSWPKAQPPGRMFVDDHHTRILIEVYDFAALRRYYHHEGVIHLEWDIAIAPEDLDYFRRRCEAQPDMIRIAPYKLYEATTSRPDPVWAHRQLLVPFGCVYLPPWALAKWRPQTDDGKLNDTTFSTWLKKDHPTASVFVEQLHLVHLHY